MEDGSGLAAPLRSLARETRLQAASSCCHRVVNRLFGRVLHPDGRFRSIWNAAMAILILYCSIAIPIEIAFEDDIKQAMCETPVDPHILTASGHLNTTAFLSRYTATCDSYLWWFWFNVFIDLIFLIDIGVNIDEDIHVDEIPTANY